MIDRSRYVGLNHLVNRYRTDKELLEKYPENKELLERRIKRHKNDIISYVTSDRFVERMK